MNLLTAKEVSEILNCSPSYVLKITRSGRLPAVNLATGTRRAEWRYRPDEVQAWVARNSNADTLPLFPIEKEKPGPDAGDMETTPPPSKRTPKRKAGKKR